MLTGSRLGPAVWGQENVLDIFQYFIQKERQFEQRGVSIEPDRRSGEPFRAEPGTDDQRGFVSANLALTEDVYVSVFEYVAVRGTGTTRLAYSYNLIIKEGTAYQWHRDPKNHAEEPVHEHEGPDRIRHTGTDPVSLDDVLERAWEEANLQLEAPLGD